MNKYITYPQKVSNLGPTVTIEQHIHIIYIVPSCEINKEHEFYRTYYLFVFVNVKPLTYLFLKTIDQLETR